MKNLTGLLITIILIIIGCKNDVVEPPPHQPPQILRITQVPEHPVIFDSCLVSAIIVPGDDSISHVNFIYNPGTSYFEKNVSNEGDSFWVYVEGVNGDNLVRYYFKAFDITNDSAISEIYSYEVPFYRFQSLPMNNVVAVGDTFSLTYRIEGVKDLFVCAASLSFDTTMIEFESIEMIESDMFDSESTNLFYHEFENTLEFAISKDQTTENDNNCGSADLVSITFRAFNAGSGHVVIEDVGLFSEDGNECYNQQHLGVNSSNISVY